MKDLANRSTCMWVRQVIELATVREKQFHACDNSEIATKTKTELGNIEYMQTKVGVQRKKTTLTQANTQKVTKMLKKTS